MGKRYEKNLFGVIFYNFFPLQLRLPYFRKLTYDEVTPYV